MDNSKTSYTRSSSSVSPSQQVRCSGATLNLTEKLYLARQKLLPLIDSVMQTSTDSRIRKSTKPNYLTSEQYEDVIWASQILKEVDEICINLKNDKCLKKSYNVNSIDLQRNQAKINKHGRIHVDTSILIQMIDTHNTLGDVINYLQGIPTEGTTTTSNDVSSYTQTGSYNNIFCEKLIENKVDRNRVSLNDKLNVLIQLNKNGAVDVAPNTSNAGIPKRSKQVSKRTQIENNEMSTLIEETTNEKKETSRPFFVNDIVIMSAYSAKDDEDGRRCRGPCSAGRNTSQDRISNSEVKISISKQQTRRTKSAGSLDDSSDDTKKVTDAAGARDIIVKCISDLNKIRSYFDMDNGCVGVSAEIQVQRSKTKENGASSSGSKHISPCEQAFKNCSCIKSGAVDVPIEEILGKEASKLIICIKGKTEEEDVQIVIRRCSDCKNIDTRVTTSSPYKTVDSNEIENNYCTPSDVNIVSERRSVTFNSDEAKCNGINVIFDPSNPSRSVVKTSTVPCPTLSRTTGRSVPCPYHSEASKSAGKPATVPCPYLSGQSKAAGKSSTVPCPYLSGQSKAAGKSSTVPCPYLSNESKSAGKSSTVPCPYLSGQSKAAGKSSTVPCPYLSNESKSAGKPSTVPCPYQSGQSKAARKSSTGPCQCLSNESKSAGKPCPYLSKLSKAAGKSPVVPCPYRSDRSKSSVKSTKIPCPFLSTTSMEECMSDCPCPANPQHQNSGRSESRTRCSKCPSDDNDEESDASYSDSKPPTRSVSCSRIKLYETTNLCFCTDDGQDLIISLTIKPKSCKPLCIKDIFSESGPCIQQRCEVQRRFETSKLDRVIPLARTKVCSSLEFDVAVMDTTMRRNGIKHLNPNIVVRLKELGVNNLLRACRPVKCGRPAVLNETIGRGIPYSASLLSLPLDDNDADIIHQSLNMSVKKIKQSNIMFKEKMDKMGFCRSSNGKKECKSVIHKVLHSKELYRPKRSSKHKSADKKLHYYINLVHDVDSSYKERPYEIMFFDIKRCTLEHSDATNNEENKPEDQGLGKSNTGSSQSCTTKMSRCTENKGSMHNTSVKILYYYINLVHDIDSSYKEQTYGVMFFYIKRYDSILEKSDPTSITSEENKPEGQGIGRAKADSSREKTGSLTNTPKVTDNNNFRHSINSVLPKNTFKMFVSCTTNISRSIEKSSSKHDSSKKNFCYYINLVHDVDRSYKQQTYEVLFFDIKRYEASTLENSDTTSTNTEEDKPQGQGISQSKPNSSQERMGLVTKVSGKNDFDQSISSISPKNNTFKKLESCTTNISSPIEISQVKSNERKKNVSRIPVYKFHTPTNSSHKAELDRDSDIYDISLHSLPPESNELIEGGKTKFIDHIDKSCHDEEKYSPANSQKGNYEYSSPSTSCSERTCILVREDKMNNIDNKHRVRLYDSPYSFELYFNDYFQPKNSERALSKKRSSKFLKKRKKKSQFRLASTRSGTFQNISKYQLRGANKDSDKTRKFGRYGDVGGFSNKDLDDINFQDVMCSFKSAFYEYLIRNSFLESKHNILRSVNSTSSLSSCKEGMSNKDLKTMFNAVKQRIIEEVGKTPQKCLSQPNVEAGMDLEDTISDRFRIYDEKSAIGPDGRVKRMRYFDSKSCRMKRSSLLPSYVRSTRSFHTEIKHVNKGCQISDRCFNEMKSILERNKEIIGGNMGSCDTFENFVVSFDSSTSTNVGSNRKLSFEDILNDYVRYSTRKKIPPTSKGLEGMMKIMEANSWLEMDVEPVRYFVYQNKVEPKVKTADSGEDGGNNESKNNVKYCCTCSNPTASSPRYVQKTKKVKKCRVCGCQLAPAVSALSKCSTCLKNTFKNKILPPIRRVCERSPQKSKSAGIMCVPRIKQKAVDTSEDKVKGHCCCSKCDHFDENGNCSCSHCLGQNDKSVGARTTCRDKSIQCPCGLKYKNENTAPSAPPDEHSPSAPPDEHSPSAPPDEHSPSAPPEEKKKSGRR